MTATAQKAYKGMGMEGPVAHWYEKITRHDLDEYGKLARRLRACMPEGGDFLEVAPGPGFLAIEMARGGTFRVTGLDISKTFVGIARKNAAEAGVRAEFRQGNASQMPFAENSFDLLVCRAAFKNFSEPVKALREIHRVLRPGATGVIVDLRRDVSMREIQRYVRGLGLSPWNRFATSLTFRFMLLRRAYTKQEIETMLEGLGFRKAEVRTNEIGMEVWVEK
ncbi:MAG: class I SAM-dependent methyltransferase [Bryobacteraceae bacterium]|jgi:ubiquinone/menaquinone biosynthesis C-methylase UbiE